MDGSIPVSRAFEAGALYCKIYAWRVERGATREQRGDVDICIGCAGRSWRRSYPSLGGRHSLARLCGEGSSSTGRMF